MKYRKIGKHYFGWADMGISYLHKYFPDFFAGFSMLVTCLDSNPRPAELVKWLEMVRSKGWGGKVIGSSVLIPAEHVKDVFENRQTFNAFDEVYLVRSPILARVEITAHFTTDGPTFVDQIPEDFLAVFHNLGACRYVSDGIGMNFACESLEIVKEIQNLEQKLRTSKL
jgi:hypothetical protein